jgi:hypothetical protein
MRCKLHHTSLSSLFLMLPAAPQVLSPTKRNACGTAQLNSQLQQLLNPPAPDKPELPAHGTHSHRSSSSSSSQQHLHSSGPVWRVGDRVVHLVNDTERDVYNGDLGVVQSVDTAEGSLVVKYPPRSGSDGVAHLVRYQVPEISEQLQLAWAITVHKVRLWCVVRTCADASCAQGSTCFARVWCTRGYWRSSSTALHVCSSTPTTCTLLCFTPCLSSLARFRLAANPAALAVHAPVALKARYITFSTLRRRKAGSSPSG